MAPLPLKKIKKIAIAIFVKTPGQSPLKTRLAKTIGEQAAYQFYLLACATIQATLKKASKLTDGIVQPIWAVAELGCFAAWQEFPHIHQGDGDLGDKLHHVYSSLLNEYDGVMLIGADAPQLTAECFIDVASRHQQGAAFVLGPANDGGFYLFSGTTPVPKNVWTGNPYSSPDTLSQLLPKIKALGLTEILKTRTDIDVYEDLPAMLNETDQIDSSLDCQKELYLFVNELIAKHT